MVDRRAARSRTTSSSRASVSGSNCGFDGFENGAHGRGGGRATQGRALLGRLGHFIANVERQGAARPARPGRRPAARAPGAAVRPPWAAPRCGSRRRQAVAIGARSIARQRPAGRAPRPFPAGPARSRPAGAQLPGVARVTRPQYTSSMRASSTRHHLRRAGAPTRIFGHRQQGVDRQHRHAGAEGQPLRHRTRGAQPGEGARAAAEDDGVQVGQAQAGPCQQVLDGGDQRRRSLRAAGGRCAPATHGRRPPPLNGDGQDFGAGIEGKQIQAMAFGATRHYRGTG